MGDARGVWEARCWSKWRVLDEGGESGAIAGSGDEVVGAGVWVEWERMSGGG